MRLKLVVLPAPFGPISATVSRSLTAKLRSCTARKPPNRRLRLRRTSATAKPAGQKRGSRFKQEGADTRAPQCADPADDRHQCRLDRDIEAERGVRIDEIDILDVEGSGERGEKRADQIDVPLDP